LVCVSLRRFREVRSLTVGVLGVVEEAAWLSSGLPGPPTPVGLSATE
jgi:hypothetical protein